jgi:UDP-N-acetylglucosamine 2-epimerase
MATAGNPFGDGRAADRIVEFLRAHLPGAGAQ